MRRALTIAAVAFSPCSSYFCGAQLPGGGAQLPITVAAILGSDGPQLTRTLSQGGSLHVIVEKGFRVKGINQPIMGKVTQPVFVGDQQVIASGSMVHGHITSIVSSGGRARVARLLDGDFTPPRIALVRFDELVAPDGQSFLVQTRDTPGLGSTKMYLYTPASQRPRLADQAKTRIHDAVHTPNKLQKVSEAAAMSLPYHPDFIDEGTVFHATLTSAVVLPSTPLADGTSPHVPGNRPEYLHLRLLTPLNSESVRSRQRIEAVVSAPFYDADRRLVYTEGVRVSGEVSTSDPAGWFHRQGALSFRFTSVKAAEGDTKTVDTKTVGVEASTDQALAINSEGVMRATSSPLKRITAVASLVGPSRGLADSSLTKTAWQRGGQGRKGFGLLGSGAAQASAATAVGLGYYGAARRVYASFIAKGTDVDLPADTALLLAVDPML